MEINKNRIRAVYCDGIKTWITKNLLLGISLAILFWTCKDGNGHDARKVTQEPTYALKIAYNVLVDSGKDNYEVFVMDLDGGNKTNITNLDGVEWCYYAYQDDIYFVSDRDTLSRNYFLYRMRPDGSHKEKISEIRLADSWHSARKNGSELVIRPHSSIADAFFMIDSTGKVTDSVIPDLAYFNDPLFSASGTEIIFRGARFKSKQEKGFVDELYSVNTDGSNLKQLTHYPEKDTTAAWYDYRSGPPRLNTRENFITYQSFQNGRYSLFAVTPDGQKQWKLTDNPQNEGWHDWSPDGKYLAIEIFDPEETQFHIGLMNWETRQLKVLTDSLYKYQQAPVFIKVDN